MKVLIVGCNGLLGQSLIQAGLADRSAEILGVAREQEPASGTGLSGYRRADISSRADLEAAIGDMAPDWIFNAAALTDVDRCEREPGLAALINRDAVGWMAAMGLPMVQVSTDYVFDGSSGPYREDDATSPLSVYGAGKLESEGLVLARSGRSLVVRTMTVWGQARGRKTSFVEFVRGSLAAGKSIRIVTDQWGNPTLAEDLALGIWKLVRAGRSGIYHVAGAELNSRFAWAQAIASHYGLDGSLIQPCLTSDLGQTARRPLKSGLVCDKLERDTGFRARDVAGQLARADASAPPA